MSNQPQQSKVSIPKPCANLAPIILNAESDTSVSEEGYYEIVTWAPPQRVLMTNKGKTDKVGMMAMKRRMAFDKWEPMEKIEACLADLRNREKYFYHMITDRGRWRCLLCDDEAMEKIGAEFGYNDDQPILKEVMQGLYENTDDQRAKLQEYVHETNEVTAMFKELSKIEHKPVSYERQTRRFQDTAEQLENEVKKAIDNGEDIIKELEALAELQ